MPAFSSLAQADDFDPFGGADDQPQTSDSPQPAEPEQVCII